MAEIVHSGQDCRTPLTGHGLYGWDGHDHRERDGECTELRMLVLEAKGRRVSLLPVWETTRGLLVHVGFRAAVIRAMDRVGFPIRQDRWYVSIASSPDI